MARFNNSYTRFVAIFIVVSSLMCSTLKNPEDEYLEGAVYEEQVQPTVQPQTVEDDCHDYNCL